MFSALVAKHLRQVRMTAAFAAATAAAIPLIPFAHRNPAHSLEGAVPLFAAALAGFWALLLAVQIFGGDRAAGTEIFLLERPIPRGVLFGARTVAAFAASLGVLALGAGAWSAAAAAAGAPFGVGGPAFLGVFAATPLLVGVAAFACALGATGFAGFAVAAFAVAWVGGAAVMAQRLFGHFLARTEALPAMWPALALAACLVPAAFWFAAWRAEACGEPLGRGRAERALRGLVVLLLSPAVFLGAAAWTARRPPSPENDGFRAQMSARTDRLFLFGEWAGNGVLFDAKTGKRLAVVPAPVVDAAWNDDGTLLAVATNAGPAGSRRDETRIEFLDQNGRRAFPPTPIGEYCAALRWAGSNLVVLAEDNAELAAAAVAPGHASGTTVGGPRPLAFLRAPQGTLFALGGKKTPETILRFDAARRVFAPAGATFAGANLHRIRFAPDGLSAAYCRNVERRATCFARAVEGGDETALDPRADWIDGWLADGRVVFQGRRDDRRCVFAQKPGAPAEELGCGKQPVAVVAPSGAGLILIDVAGAPGPLIYDASARAFARLPGGDSRWPFWAGERTFVRGSELYELGRLDRPVRLAF